MLKTHRAQQTSASVVIERALDIGACNSRVVTVAGEWALRCSCPLYRDAGEFCWWEHSLRERGIVTPTVLVNTYHPRTVLIIAKEDAIIADTQRDLRRISCDTAWELGLSSRGCSTFFATNTGIHTTTRKSLFKHSSSANENLSVGTTSREYWWTPFCPTVGAYMKRLLRLSLCSLPTSLMWARIILPQFAKLGINSSSTTKFGLLSSEQLLWVRVCNLIN